MDTDKLVQRNKEIVNALLDDKRQVIVDTLMGGIYDLEMQIERAYSEFEFYANSSTQKADAEEDIEVLKVERKNLIVGMKLLGFHEEIDSHFNDLAEQTNKMWL